MTFILDSDTLALYRQARQQLVVRVSKQSQFQIVTTVITVEEQLTGWQALLRQSKGDAHLAYTYQRLTDSVRALSGFHILTFSEAAIARYNLLLAMKLNVGKMDLRIAAIALEAGATVITRNLRDFQRVPGLICENWAD
jgi:tRNA(fMet)-specific endonuclease VapC